MNVTEALETYKAALDEHSFLVAQRIDAWVLAYRQYADGRPWSQTEAAIRAEVSSLDAEVARCENNVRAARAELDVEMLKVRFQVGARAGDLDVDYPG